MSAPTILLVDTIQFPPSEFAKILGKEVGSVFYHYQIKPFPLGLLYVASYLKQMNPDARVEVLDLNNTFSRCMETNYFRDHSLDDFLAKHFAPALHDLNPEVVGLQYLFSSSNGYVSTLAALTKKLLPSAAVVVGGNAATAVAGILLDDPHIDYVVRGEGERPFFRLVEHLAASTPGEPDIPGVWGKTLRSPALDLIDDLDDIPFLNLDLLLTDKEWYFNQLGWGRITYPEEWAEPGAQYRSLAFLHSRGCPFQCIFCASHVVHGRKLRQRSVDNVRQELEKYRTKYGINRILANDDTFNFDKERTLALCKIIADLGMELVLPNNISMRVLDEDICEAFKSTHTKSLHVAIESGNQDIQLKVMKKKLDLEDIRRKTHLLRRYNFWSRAYWVLGLPGENPQTVKDTIDYAASLPLDWNVFHMATPLTGSEMFEIATRDGLLTVQDASDIHYENLSMDVLRPYGMSIKDVYEYANISVNFLNNYNMTHGDTRRAVGAFKDVVKCYPFHAIAWSCLKRCYEDLGDEAGVTEASRGLDHALTNAEGRQLYEKYVVDRFIMEIA
jgi:radical SAM superfamily enzyme YgiQ (UPF0313 family)